MKIDLLEKKLQELQIVNDALKKEIDACRLSQVRLLEQEKLYESIIENVSSGVALIDDSGRFILYNTKFLNLFGLSVKSSIRNVNDQNWSDWRVINENGELLHVDEHPVRKAALTGKKVNNQLVGVVLPAGDSPTWMLISAEPLFNQSGAIEKTICTYQDITAFKLADEALSKSEERLRIALEAAELGTWDFDIATGVAFHSLRHDQIFGYSGLQKEWSYEISIQHMLPEYHKMVRESVENALKTGKLSYEAEILWPDGTIHWIAPHGRVRYNKKGRPVRMVGVVSDITEHKKTETRLKYQADLLANISDAVYATDLKFQVTEWNQAAQRIYGWDEKEVLGKSIFEVTGSKVDPRMREKLQNELFEKGWMRAQIEHTDRSGATIIFDSMTIANKDSNGNIIGFVAVNRDNTEITKADQILQRSQITFGELVERAPFGIYVIDSSFCIAHMNKESQTGAFKNVHPVIGRPFSEAMHILWSESVAEEIIAHFRHTLITGEPYYSPRFINLRNDIEIAESYEWELHRLTLPDGQKGVVCYYFDSTRLREAEKALLESETMYRNIVETANEGIMMANSTGYITFVNKKMADLLGYEVDELVGKSGFDLISQDEIESSKTRVELRKNGKVESYDIKFNRKDGETIWMQANGSPIYDSEGIHTGNLAMYSDITKRKKAEIELKNSEIQLRELIAAKNKFFNIIAHDLKNPFTSLIGSSEILVENINNLGAEKTKALSIIMNDASKHGYAILQNLLDWSRSQTGMLKLNPEKINLRDLIDEQVRNLAQISANKEIEIHSSVKKDIFMIVDRNVINTILRNLFSNAVKFTHRKGKVVISSKWKDNMRIITVKDNGIGISPENIKTLFSLDSKHTKPGTELEQGTGLGLKLCKEFVEKLGGEIWIKSAENEGSEFSFSFPDKNVNGNNIKPVT